MQAVYIMIEKYSQGKYMPSETETNYHAPCVEVKV
jgi:hypothetical protein